MSNSENYGPRINDLGPSSPPLEQVSKDGLVAELRRGTGEYDGIDKIMDEAADEIERLRKLERAVIDYFTCKLKIEEELQRIESCRQVLRSHEQA